jgi:hypothetical protein
LSDEFLETIADKDTSGDPEKLLDDKEIYEELYKGISALPEKARETLVLYYFSDMKYRDIAEMTNTSIKTVSTNLIRARKQLKVHMKERCPEISSISPILSALSINVMGSGIVAGGGIKSGALIGKGISAAISNAVAPIAVGTAGVMVAAVTAYAILATPNYAIALSGDCECGHINPQSIEIEGVRVGDSLGEWELLANDGSTIYTGDLDAVTNYVSGLEKTRRNGHYTLRCIITNKSGGSYAVTRDITIGNLVGDD